MKTKLSFQAQIFCAMLLLLIIPTLILGVTTANSTALSVSEQYKSTLNSLTRQVNLTVDTLLADADKIFSLHLINDDIRRVLTKEYDDNMYEYALDSRMMMTQISQANRLNPNVIISVIQSKNGYSFFYGTTTTKDADETVQTMQELAVHARLEPRQSYVGSIYNRKYSGTIFKNILPMVKILKDPQTNKEIGVFYLGVNFNAVANILESSQLPSSQIAFLNQNNQLFFSSDNQFFSDGTQQPLADQFTQLATSINAQNPEGVFRTDHNGMVYDINIVYNQSTGWKLVHFMDNSIVNNAFAKNTANFALLFVVNILIGLLLAYVTSHSLTRSITALCRQIDACDLGALGKITVHSHTSRELDKVASSYNSLLERLTDSMHQNYLTSLNEKKIRLKMLQMQINPHFLYNTLNTISSLANIYDAPEIVAIATDMSDMLRYNLKTGSLVTLADEIEQLQKYMVILAYRFPGKFILECAIRPGLGQRIIPAFLLQPLVENAITHGMEEKESGYLSVNAYAEDGLMHILVSDTGCGIEPVLLAKINHSLSHGALFSISTATGSSIGIVNVHQRIQAYYGKQYGLKLQSKLGQGTIVDLCLPLDQPPLPPPEYDDSTSLYDQESG